MSGSNYTRKISANCSQDDVFQALTTHIGEWWTQPSASLAKPGDEAVFRFPPQVSFWRFRAEEISPARIEWECVEAHHVFDGQAEDEREEWLGSRVVFDVSAQGPGVTVRFEHVGLSKSLKCYEVCEAGWDFFFLRSLKAYLETGEGAPHAA